MEELGLSARALAAAIGVTPQTVINLIDESSAVSPAMALRLGTYFGNGPDLWMRLQADVDLWDTRQKIAAELSAIKPVKRSA
jgi:addiction module HigA family antidote